MKTHTGEKLYNCTECGRTFAQKNTFTKHMKIHIGGKPYQCAVCKKKFSYKIALNTHTRRHAKETL